MQYFFQNANICPFWLIIEEILELSQEVVFYALKKSLICH